MSFDFHTPVLLNEVIHYLNPRLNQNFIDCTVGGGGHALAILKRIEPRGRLLGIDADEAALRQFKVQSSKFKVKDRVILVEDNFRNLKSIVKKLKFRPVNGILLDLGMSSYQIEQSGRGFSFQKDEPLDMRFSSSKFKVQSSKLQFKIKNFTKYPITNLTAEKIINEWSERELENIFRIYGEESQSWQIAKAICQARQKQKISTTPMLVQIITQTKTKFFFSKIHPATKVFQALRIAINDELDALTEVLPQSIDILQPGGRLAIISFHSLEDRIVKHFFRKEARSCLCQPKSPICVCQHQPQLKILTKSPIIASTKEINLNPRARSAKMRVAEKIG